MAAAAGVPAAPCRATAPAPVAVAPATAPASILAAPQAAVVTADARQAESDELVVPVTVTRGSAREIVLRIVLKVEG